MYKGDLTPLETMERLSSSQNAVLLDVRTVPEWNYVGVPAVERLLTVEWQTFPAGAVNAGFVAQVEQAGVSKDVEIYTICRSGVRSIAAAQALTAAGFENAYNVLEGFEGDKDPAGHRGSVGGWKFHGLPWTQG
ncbi:MAG: rhodanese-like domain-containing protein [Alphaproteobacteria bacterium]|nr:rhodanese-like domain-containing protein [Alphaproteobacteria bacterium]